MTRATGRGQISAVARICGPLGHIVIAIVVGRLDAQ